MHEEYVIDGVKVEVIGVANFDREEARRYVEFVKQNPDTPDNFRLKYLRITAAPDGSVDLDYVFDGPKFERIRRITGYLTGTLDSWNNSKRAEERDRVKHGLDGVAV
ncbi:MAG: hypothetical protein IJ668_06255 [Selenomonadaceae bacterium]|nr:hypothetical protein [Selenomonadaceae bacterium]